MGLFCRDVIKWLFSAIMKSTGHGESSEAAGEVDEQIRWIATTFHVFSFSLAQLNVSLL